MSHADLHILYEDNHLLAIDKPAGLPTMGTPGDRPTLLTLAKQYVKRRYDKPGNVYLGAMSRLDAPVTGVVLFARTSKAAARLTRQFHDHTVEKNYWAIVEGNIIPAEGKLIDWLAQDERHRRMHIVGSTFSGAKEARLTYRKIAPTGCDSLIEVVLETGRKHQIRLQMAHLGHPLLGDLKYGGRRPFPNGIALHARRLVVMHPVKYEPVELVSPLPDAWRRLGVEA
jgi:23S rRNA pseudouridine1911/1915/1917 synthase